MSPRRTPSSAHAQTTSPYTSRPVAQKKKSRRLYTSCGACRMRRVRCNLKNLSSTGSSHVPCSNCKDRGLNCVNEYAAIKVLRRGRRLHQVEAIYGKGKGNHSRILLLRTPDNIPALKSDFFSSKFWAWFCIQRPVLDPNEFSQRYLAHVEGTNNIGPEGMMLSMLLVLWAASFGLDESGTAIGSDYDNDNITRANGNRHQQKISMMLERILKLIDLHGILRRPTLDGTRILLLVLPLMEERSYPERTIIYGTALSHTRMLCNPRPSLPFTFSFLSTIKECLPLARILLYAQIQEGTAATLKGNHLVFHDDDIDALQTIVSSSIHHLRLSPLSSTSSAEAAVSGHPIDKRTVPILGKQLMQLTFMPLRLSLICRKSHELLMGLKATRRIEEHHLVNANGMHEVWRDFEKCWQEFVAMRKDPLVGFEKANMEYFTDAWLVCIFGCHYCILESLKRFSSATNPGELSTNMSDHNAVPCSVSCSDASSPYLPPNQLYMEARTRCIHLLPHILRLVRHHLTKSDPVINIPVLFAWDTGLVRDGCFFAGLLAADMYGSFECLDEHQVKPEETSGCITPEEGVDLILSALAKMHGVFSKSEEKSETIRVALQRSKEKYQGQQPAYPCLLSNTFGETNPYTEHNEYLQYTLYSHSHWSDIDVTAGLHRHRTLPNLSIHLLPQRRAEPAQNTSCSSAWRSYTPPTMADSAPILSSRGSLGFHSSLRGDQAEATFSFTPWIDDGLVQITTADRIVVPVSPDGIYQHRDALYDTHDF